MVLEHQADETRHAYIFKRLSQSLSDNGDAYLCENEAVNYFQSLDRQMAEWLKEKNFAPTDSYPNYLLTTSLIERRAMALYPVYRDTTSQESVRDELKQIIAEEMNHRPGIDECLKDLLQQRGIQGLKTCWELEEKLFQQFAKALCNEVL
jgi:rubrerythrin